MAHDDGKEHSPVSHGESGAPSPPESPDTHHMRAQAQPEAVGTPEAASVAPAPPAGGSPGAASPAPGDHQPSSEAGSPASDVDRLREEVDKARAALDAKQAELHQAEERSKAAQAAAQMIAAYEAGRAALLSAEEELKQFRAAETSFLETMLPTAAQTAIRQVEKAPRDEIDGLRTTIDTQEKDAAQARRDLAEARAAAAAAKEKADELKHPGQAISDRLKRADAVRAEVKKAIDAGNYALAYWLTIDGGGLDREISGDPKIVPPETLTAAIDAAAAAQVKADAAVTDLDQRVTALDTSVQEAKSTLATHEAALEGKILDALGKLNPPSAQAA